MDPMLNRAPYDLIADQWTQERKLLPREKPYLEHFIALAIPGAHILDLGCGPGIMTRYLLDRGVRVTGVDSSLEMLRRAQVTCPEAEFIAGDMLTLKLTRRYQGIVAWDSVFHIPRTEHGRLFSDMYQWLEHNTPLLLSIGGSEDEFTAPMFGVDFFYSGHSPDVSLACLRDAGFQIVRAEVDDPSSRGHVAVLCRKPEKTEGQVGQRLQGVKKLAGDSGPYCS
jgi:SAM-dependent methyltransferase